MKYPLLRHENFTYSYFQVNRPRGRGARPCAPTTDVVQILEFCCNINLSPNWVLVLENAGFEAVHWSTIGNPSATDKVIMAWVLTNDYIVFTDDLDFGTLLAMTQTDAPSVIQVRSQIF